MNNLPIPISSDEFKNNISIRFNNILDGFDNYENFTINGNISNNGENDIINFISHIFAENDDECYIDFYMNKLNDSEKENLMNSIDKEHRLLLKAIIDIKHNDIYYRITDKTLLPFFIKLCTKELFFITFYFRKKPATIWGNYNLKFPCFFDDSNVLNHYYHLAENYKLID